MDNIMGKLPTKKPPVSVAPSETNCKCEVCGLEFSGQVVLDTHLAGAKHAKKVKSQEILKQLQSSGQTFSRDEKTKILKCEVCDVVVNSSQQLQTHLAGNKHKQKVQKKASQGSTPLGKSALGSSDSQSPNSTPNSNLPGNDENKGDGDRSPPEMSTSPLPAVPLPQNGGGDVPKKMPEGGGARASKYFCDTCGVSLNSEIQLEQHLGSRKHKDRAANGGKPRPRHAPYWRKPRGSSFGNGSSLLGIGGIGGNLKPGMSAGPSVGGKLPGPSLPYTPPLSSTFVSGGPMM